MLFVCFFYCRAGELIGRFLAVVFYFYPTVDSSHKCLWYENLFILMQHWLLLNGKLLQIHENDDIFYSYFGGIFPPKAHKRIRQNFNTLMLYFQMKELGCSL